jgi:hypothetical protein
MGQKGESKMSYLNSVTLVGFVGADPEQRQGKGNGAKFTVLSVATQRSWKNGGATLFATVHAQIAVGAVPLVERKWRLVLLFSASGFVS